MKRVTASQARRDWFRILDEVVAGEVVVIERNGQRVRIEREDPETPTAEIPDYSRLLRVDRPEDADRWRWSWSPEGDATLREDREIYRDDEDAPAGEKGA